VLCLYDRKPAVIMIVGVNGGGKTTSLGNSLAYFTTSSKISGS
jgi:signal recognition particle GTPase